MQATAARWRHQAFERARALLPQDPLGALEAHRRAFGDSPDHLLVLKTHGTDRAGPAWEAVARAAAARPNLRILDADLSRPDLWALTACADVLLSLHRAEGYGLVIAEAMTLGRPVVATGWSGNTDFMQGPGCHLVPWTPVPARDPQGIYDMPQAFWAEPDLDAAAAALRRIDGNPALRHPPAVRIAPPDYRAALGLAP